MRNPELFSKRLERLDGKFHNLERLLNTRAPISEFKGVIEEAKGLVEELQDQTQNEASQ